MLLSWTPSARRHENPPEASTCSLISIPRAPTVGDLRQLHRRAARTLRRIAALCAIAASLRAQTTLYIPRGDNPLDQFGFCVSGAGDVDGDGFDDFIVGTHDNSVAHHNFARVLSGQTG